MGKIERMHRTLQAEFLQGRRFLGFAAAQAGLDTWRRHYNHDRPHDALGGQSPASRYRIAEVDFRTTPERPSVTHLFAHL